MIDELPYQGNKAQLLIKIGELVRDKKLEGISDLRDGVRSAVRFDDVSTVQVS